MHRRSGNSNPSIASLGTSPNPGLQGQKGGLGHFRPKRQAPRGERKQTRSSNQGTKDKEGAKQHTTPVRAERHGIRRNREELDPMEDHRKPGNSRAARDAAGANAEPEEGTGGQGTATQALQALERAQTQGYKAKKGVWGTSGRRHRHQEGRGNKHGAATKGRGTRKGQSSTPLR